MTGQGWDRADYRCGRCGAKRTAATEKEYVRMYAAHQDAHAVADRLDPIERDGMASILRTLLADVVMSAELLVVLEAVKHEQP